MNYEKAYNNLMSTRLEMKTQRIKEKRSGVYFEGHHILPKYLGGEGNSRRPKNCDNIVLLTAREHFLAHWLLWRIHRDRPSALAFHKMMSITKHQHRVKNARAYDEARQAFSESQKGNMYGKGHTKTVSEEQRRKQSEKMTGRYVGDLNPSKLPEVRAKISSRLKGRIRSESHTRNLIEALKNRPKDICEWCKAECNHLNHTKWHGDNCKMNPNGCENRSIGLSGEMNPMYGKPSSRAVKIRDLETEIIFPCKAAACTHYDIDIRVLNKWLINKHRCEIA